MANVPVNVQRGTRSLHSKRLCDSCEQGVVIRGVAEGEEQVFCTLMERNVAIRVAECSQYRDNSQPPLWALKDIAWTLDIDRKCQRIGFTKPDGEDKD